MDAVKNKRGGHRARTTTLSASITTELSKAQPCKDTIESLVIELERQRDYIVELDESIANQLTDNALIEDINDASEKIMKINFIITKAKKFLTSNGGNVENRQNANNTQSKTVKLPQLTLVKFSGNPLDWLKFWELFRTSVHNRTDLPAPVKFQYLTGQLEGEAAKLLAGFNHSETEYNEAVELLNKTYGQRKTLVQARLNAILDLPNPEATVASLSNFRSSYEGHLRVLKCLQCNTDEAGYVYAHILLRKLPLSTKDNLNRAKKTEVWSLDQLRDSLNEEIQHLESLQDKAKQGSNGKVNHTNTYTASFSVGASSNPKLCRFCNKNHLTHNCDTYNSAKLRKQRASDLKLCYNCLLSNHNVAKCLNSGRCRHCGKKHHSSICTNTSDKKFANKEKQSTYNNELKKANALISTSTISGDNYSSLLPTANVTLKNDNLTMNCKALLDAGSQRTFVLSSVVKDLNLETCGSINLEVDGFESVGTRKKYDLVKLDVVTTDGVITIDAITINHMPTRLSMPGRSKLARSLTQKGIKLADDSDTDQFVNLQLIIGIDNYHKFVQGNEICKDVYSIPSNLGTVIVGKLPNTVNQNASVTTILKVATFTTDSELDSQIHKLWDLDTVGIKEPNSEDNLAVKKFRESIQFVDGKYLANLPWKGEDVKLPTNKALSYKRLLSVWDSLLKDTDKLAVYNSIIEEQLKLGFIEPVQREFSDSDKVHYIPHHSVQKKSETTPIRIVFDCSAKQSNTNSLNDCLLTGPSLVNDLTSILLRFRLKQFACTADIEKAFLMVGLNEVDRDSCRFFWPKDPFNRNSDILTYRFRVVLFGSTASQFLLNSTICHHLSKHATCNSDKLLNNLYIDNVLCSFTNESDLLMFYHDSKDIMAKGNFNLREWCTNSQVLRTHLANADGCTKEQVSALGVCWHTSNDQLVVTPHAPSKANTITKRTIVSSLAKTFDPYGFMMPITVTGKIFIQDLWKLKLGWDQKIPDDKIKQWNKHISDLQNVELKLPRCMKALSNPTLHIFADSSNRCYGAVAYFVESSTVQFVIAKSRLAPVKTPTLPQLELTAVNIAARLAKFLIETYNTELSIKQVILWSDSEIVVHWLKSTVVHSKPYVRQRVANIRELCPTAQINHVPGSMNPADLLTRGVSSKEFTTNKLWLEGPRWLVERNLPNQTVVPMLCNKICTENASLPVKSEPVINVSRYHSYQTALRITALVRKFISKTTNCINEKFSCSCSGFCVKCINKAEVCLIKMYQKENFPEILNYFETKATHKPSLVYQLKLALINGVIRSLGRLKNASMTESCKYPVLLPTNSAFTNLIISEAHTFTLHSGVNGVLSYLREKWWVPRGRQAVKKIISKCVHCIKVQGKPYTFPADPPLPAGRVEKARPFQVCGVDYTGALSVKFKNEIIKAYIVLFTCAVTRAIHLEVVYSLSAEDFLRALIKFSSRRSFPQILYSDNATNFVATADTLKDISNSPTVCNYLSNNRLEWRFITPRAAWHGGIWERLIGITKTTLKKVIGKALLNSVDLETIITQIECKLNDRPLTYLSSDIKDLQPLTPSHLMFGFKLNEFPDIITQEELDDPTFGSKEKVSKAYLHRTKVLNETWFRWRHEYLTSIRERYSNKGGDSNVKVGQVVLIGDATPRVNWKMGIIVELLPSSDGQTRSVKVKTNSGYLTRPISKLYPLEIQCIDSNFVKPIIVNLDRPKREAAQRALNAMKINY